MQTPRANPLLTHHQVGCWLAGSLSDMLGRIVTIQVSSLLWVAGSVVSVCVVNMTTLLVGRAVKGVSVGMLSATVALYLIEISPSHKRGLATSALQWCLTWGVMVMFYLSYVCLNIDEDGSFRLAWAIEGVPGLLLFVLSFFLPESPKWLASKGRWHEAATTMERLELSLEGRKPVIEPPPAGGDEGENANSTSNLEYIERVISRFENNLQTCSYADLLHPSLRYHLLAGVATQAVVQLSGIGVLMYYLVFICEMIGLQGDSKILSASLQYVINVVFTIAPIMWLDKLRRKDVLVYGSTSLGICITSIGAIMGASGHRVPPVEGNATVVWGLTGTPGSVCLALCFLFVAIFAASLSCAAWLYTNEILPSRAKAKGSAICMSVSWVLSFILTFLAPVLLSTIVWGTFLLFGLCCFLGSVLMVLWLPETYGLSEGQINNVFGTADPPREIELEKVRDEKFAGSSTSKASSSGHTRSGRHSQVQLHDHTSEEDTGGGLCMGPSSRLAPPSEAAMVGGATDRVSTGDGCYNMA